MYYRAPTYDIDEKTWGYTEFGARKDVVSYINSQVKYPGEYNLKYTEGYWNEQAKYFQSRERVNRKGSYPLFMPRSLDFKKHWDFEKEKCAFDGFVIYKKKSEKVEFAVPGLMYWYLNYCPIVDKIKRRLDFPDIYDGDYHYFLYILRCLLLRKYGVVLKKRQAGYTLKNMAILLNAIWFGNSAVSKLFASEERSVNDSWSLMENYRDHINEFCGWKRGFDPGKKLDWQVRRKKKDSSGYVGNKSIAKGFTTKQDPTNGVGGMATVLFGEEAGKNPTLDITHEYITSNVGIGGLTTGLIIYSGAVGELEKADPLKEFITHPEDNDFLACENKIEDDLEFGGMVGFFAPEWWNYVSGTDDQEEDFGEIKKYFDEWGNSDKEGSLKEIYKKRERAKLKKPESYRYYCSQRPLSIKEAFAIRKDSKFPAHLIEAQRRRIENKEYPMEFVELDRDDKGKVIVRQSNKLPIREFPISKKTEDKTGVIVMYERPIDNPEFHTYYASIDPVRVGKAEFVENRLFTPTGRKRIGDVVVGDKIIGANGRPIFVTGVFPQGKVRLCRVTFNDGSSVLVCEDHLWTVRLQGGGSGGSRGWITLSTKQLMDPENKITLLGTGRNSEKKYTIKTFFKREGGKQHNRWQIPVVAPIHFEGDKLPLDPYLVGLLLGDGGLTARGVRFTTADDEIISTLTPLLPEGVVAKKGHTEYDYRFSGKFGNKSNPVLNALRELGLMGLSSEKKFIPDCYKYSSVHNRLAILQGLMDTDGYAAKNVTQFYSTSEKLAQGVIEIVNSLGGTARLSVKETSYTHKGERRKGKDCFVVSVKLPPDIVPFRLSRKANIHRKKKNFISRYISDIRFEKIGEAVCISVDAPDQLYVTENAIVTHNTQTSVSLVSIQIYKNDIEVTRIQHGEAKTFIEGGKLVAEWCGRFDDPTKNHERCELLIELYNAWTVVENNVTNFIQHMIERHKQKYLVPADQMFFNKDLPSSGNVYQKYGWTNNGRIFTDHFLNYAVDFCKDELQHETKDDGTIVRTTYGIERIPSIMLLKEMEAYQDGVNVDRLVSWSALVAFSKMQRANRGFKKRVENLDEDSKKKQKDLYAHKPMPFKNIGGASTPESQKFVRNAFKNIR